MEFNLGAYAIYSGVVGYNRLNRSMPLTVLDVNSLYLPLLRVLQADFTITNMPYLSCYNIGPRFVHRCADRCPKVISRQRTDCKIRYIFSTFLWLTMILCNLLNQNASVKMAIVVSRNPEALQVSNCLTCPLNCSLLSIVCLYKIFKIVFFHEITAINCRYIVVYDWNGMFLSTLGKTA